MARTKKTTKAPRSKVEEPVAEEVNETSQEETLNSTEEVEEVNEPVSRNMYGDFMASLSSSEREAFTEAPIRGMYALRKWMENLSDEALLQYVTNH